MMADDWYEAEKLHFASQHGNAEEVAKLLAEGFDPNAFDTIGQTPLHYAAEHEHFEIIRLLLAHGADVDAHHLPTAGDTPLAHVAQTCTLKMAQLLVAAGANPTIPGFMHVTAIHQAKQRKRGEGPRVYEFLCRSAGLMPDA